MQAIDVVRRLGVRVSPHRPIRDAAKIMDQAGVGCLAVVDDNRLVGIVTDPTWYGADLPRTLHLPPRSSR